MHFESSIEDGKRTQFESWFNRGSSPGLLPLEFVVSASGQTHESDLQSSLYLSSYALFEHLYQKDPQLIFDIIDTYNGLLPIPVAPSLDKAIFVEHCGRIGHFEDELLSELSSRYLKSELAYR